MSLAIAVELQKKYSGIRILFVGTSSGLENRLVPARGYPLRTIRIGGMKNLGPGKGLKTLFQIPTSLVESWRIVREFSPAVIAGVGGYSSGPAVLAGRLQGVPAVILEPNVLPGLTNRLLKPWVNRALVAFEETARYFGKKGRLTGIPVRREFFEIPPYVPAEGPLRVLIFGGSQGSRSINDLVCEALPELPEQRIELIHQTGPADLRRIFQAYRTMGRRDLVTGFIEDMPQAFARADLIVSRAGALTVAELCSAGRPAVLIPFPGAADDHQRRNAMALAEQGAAILFVENESDGRRLARLLLELESDRERLRKMGAAARSLAHPHSMAEIVATLVELGGAKPNYGASE